MSGNFGKKINLSIFGVITDLSIFICSNFNNLLIKLIIIFKIFYIKIYPL